VCSRRQNSSDESNSIPQTERLYDLKTSESKYPPAEPGALFV
jgi:hypothetical protein